MPSSSRPDFSGRLWLEALRLLARPIARFCLRHSLRIQDALEALKIAFVLEAQAEIKKDGREANVSRMSVVTGIHRRDVTRIAARGDTRDEPQGMITRLIGHWQHAPAFTTKKGDPRVLSISGEESEFAALVRAISKDLKPGTVLFELERTGTVERTSQGVRLVRQAFTTEGDPLPTLQLMARDVGELIQAVEENACGTHSLPNLHARTHYDRIVASAESQIRDWLMERGAQFHREARAFLAQHDLDVNPRLSAERTIRVSLGTFALTYGDKEAKGD